jgi:competence protein ComEA
MVMQEFDLRTRLAALCGALRACDRRKLLVRILVVLAATVCLVSLALGSCGSTEYGVFEPNAANAGEPASDAQITPTTQFDTATDEDIADTSTTAVVIVFVSGAVENPGLYELEAGQRIGDAVNMAGGIRADGAMDAVNLAAPLEDGQQIRIPTAEEAAAASAQPGAATSDGTLAGSGEGDAGQSTTASAGISAEGKVNINTADATTLQTLTGIGPATAQKIIDYRTANGPFASIEELRNVSGIGEKKYAAIAGSICV